MYLLRLRKLAASKPVSNMPVVAQSCPTKKLRALQNLSMLGVLFVDLHQALNSSVAKASRDLLFLLPDASEHKQS